MNIILKFFFFLNKNKTIGKIAHYILNIAYLPINLYLKFSPRPRPKKKYYFSICAIFKDEAVFFKEWIEYHKLIGVDHIYLYNNFSEDNYMTILQPYISQGYVTLTDWPYMYSQIQAYEDCYHKYKNETFWLAFIDIDEFICPKYEYNIKDWIRQYEGYPAVAMYWQMFGTCGIMKQDLSRLVIEQFTTSWEKLNGTGKYILCTDKSFNINRIGVHFIFSRRKFLGVEIKIPMISEDHRFIFFPDLYLTPQNNTIQLNHYFSKSFENYYHKINKGEVANKDNEAIRKNKIFFINHEKHNISENRVIFRFLTLLKEQMQID